MTIQAPVPCALPCYLQSFREAFDHGNPNELADLFAEDAVFDCGGGHLVVGRHAIKYALTNFLIHGLKLHINVLCVIEAGDVACVKTEWSLKGMNKVDQLINLAGRALHVFARAADGGWKLKIFNPFLQAN